MIMRLLIQRLRLVLIRGPKFERIEPKILSPGQSHDLERLADRLKSGRFFIRVGDYV